MTTTDQTTTDSMLAAHALCGQLIESMPDGVVFASWEIMPGYVGGGYSTLEGSNDAKRGLALLASRFGLVYSEESKSAIVSVKASGEIDDIEVSLWAHVNRPQTKATGDPR